LGTFFIFKLQFNSLAGVQPTVVQRAEPSDQQGLGIIRMVPLHVAAVAARRRALGRPNQNSAGNRTPNDGAGLTRRWISGGPIRDTGPRREPNPRRLSAPTAPTGGHWLFRTALIASVQVTIATGSVRPEIRDWLHRAASAARLFFGRSSGARCGFLI